MVTKFGKQYPMIAGTRSERERLLFVAAAGLALSLLVITLLVVNFKNKADAKLKSPAPSDAIPSVVNTISLLAPERPIAQGKKLSSPDIRFKEVFWPRSQVPEEAIRDISEVANLYAKIELPAGMPISRANLTTELGTIVLPVTPGMRAVTIEVDATAGLEGHALPGTHVDVVLTYHTEEQKLISKVIVPNARVLSYAGDTTPSNQRNAIDKAVAPVVGKTITLEVSVEHALSIQTARQMGKLNLIMRHNDDVVLPPVQEVGQNEVEGGNKRVVPQNCSRGKMKMEGREFIIDCDNKISEIIDPNEP